MKLCVDSRQTELTRTCKIGIRENRGDTVLGSEVIHSSDPINAVDCHPTSID